MGWDGLFALFDRLDWFVPLLKEAPDLGVGDVPADLTWS